MTRSGAKQTNKQKTETAAKGPSPVTLGPDRERERTWDLELPETLWAGLHVQGIVSIAHTPALPSQRLGFLRFTNSLRE